MRIKRKDLRQIVKAAKILVTLLLRWSRNKSNEDKERVVNAKECANRNKVQNKE